MVLQQANNMCRSFIQVAQEHSAKKELELDGSIFAAAVDYMNELHAKNELDGKDEKALFDHIEAVMLSRFAQNTPALLEQDPSRVECPRLPSNFVWNLRFSPSPQEFRNILLSAPELALWREALEEHGFAVELPISGAKVFVQAEERRDRGSFAQRCCDQIDTIHTISNECTI